MAPSLILAAAGALTAASIEVLLPAHGTLPTSSERWGAEPTLLAAAIEGALVFLLFGRWLPTEAPWRDRPADPDPDAEGSHHLTRRIAVSAPLLMVYVGQRFLLGAERIGLVLASTLADAAGSWFCDGSGSCATSIAVACIVGINLLFAFSLMGPVWWLEAEASSSWDRHHPYHRHHAGFWH